MDAVVCSDPSVRGESCWGTAGRVPQPSGTFIGNPPQFREHFNRALVEANAEEPLEVLGCGYEEGCRGWDEHNGEVFLINRRFVFEREAEQCGV